MPSTSLNASSTRKSREKNVSMVRKAMTSSIVQPLILVVEGEGWEPTPNVERPSARRTMWSMCCRAAVVARLEVVVDSTEREVAVEGMGRGTWVARNMW